MLPLGYYGLSSSFHGLKLSLWQCMAPLKGEDKERERFWNNLERVLDRVVNGYRLSVLGDLN